MQRKARIRPTERDHRVRRIPGGILEGQTRQVDMALSRQSPGEHEVDIVSEGHLQPNSQHRSLLPQTRNRLHPQPPPAPLPRTLRLFPGVLQSARRKRRAECEYE